MKSIFKYCPNCASTDIEFPNNVRFECYNCGFTYFHNIAAAVAVVFKQGDKILFTVRNIDPDKGKLDLPGGFIDPNETAQEAACREVKEELGIEVVPSQMRFLTTFPNNYLYKEVPYRTMDMFFLCELPTTQLSITAPDEIKSLEWFPIAEIPVDKIGFLSIRTVTEMIINKELAI